MVIAGPFIRADLAPLLNLLDDMSFERDAPRVWYDPGHNVAVTLQHPENDCLALVTAPALSPFVPTTDQRFVGFNMPLQNVVAINLSHVLPDFMADAPSGLISDAQLPLEFLSGDAVPRRGEQVHGVEPFLERSAGVLEGRPDHGVNMVAAPRAAVRRKLREPSEAAFLGTFGTDHNLAEAEFH
jgi:hypothetical protein